jgi:hypothetical protein
VASACDVAVTVTLAGLGTVAGAAYTPALVIFPLPAPPATLHVTAVFVVPVTVAVKVCVCPTTTVAVEGATVTLTNDFGAVMLPPPQPVRVHSISKETNAIILRVMNIPWKGRATFPKLTRDGDWLISDVAAVS